jgi:quinol monooxygenase YgiN
MKHDGAPASPFIVLSVFTSVPEFRDSFVNLIEEFAASQTRLQPGICSLELFTDESSEHIVTLARWKDRASFEAFKQSQTGAHASEVARTLTPKVYFLRQETVFAGGQDVPKVLAAK